MSLVLSGKGFLKALSLFAEEDVSFVIPKGMTKKETVLMDRVMRAKNSSEIEDISDEDLLTLFDCIEEYSSYLGLNNFFVNDEDSGGEFQNRLDRFHSCRKRRVL